MNMLELQLAALMREPAKLNRDINRADRIRNMVEFIHREGNVSLRMMTARFDLGHDALRRDLEEAIAQGKIRKFRVGNTAWYCNPNPAPRRK